MYAAVTNSAFSLGQSELPWTEKMPLKRQEVFGAVLKQTNDVVDVVLLFSVARCNFTFDFLGPGTREEDFNVSQC